MSGTDARFTTKFWMQCPMFLPVVASTKPSAPTHLHPWVVAADRASYSYRANPRPPVVYGRKNGLPAPIKECEPNHLCPGDVVAVTFTVAYILTDKEWYPQYQPVEIYVLKPAPRSDLDEYDTAASIRTPPPTMGVSVVEGALVKTFADLDMEIDWGQHLRHTQHSSGMMRMTTKGKDIEQVSVESADRLDADRVEGVGASGAAWAGGGNESDEPDPNGDTDRASVGIKQEPLSPIGWETTEAPLSQPKSGSDLERAKSTSSTLSEEVEDRVLSEGEVAPRADHSKGPNRKRVGSKAIELEGCEAPEDGQDTKRKPRKSARLG